MNFDNFVFGKAPNFELKTVLLLVVCLIYSIFRELYCNE